MKKKLLVGLVTSMVIFVVVEIAKATPVTINLSGHISTVDSQLSSYFIQNENVSVTINYNTETIPTWSAIFGSGYRSGPLIIQAGKYGYSSIDSSLCIHNDAPYDEIIMPYINLSGLDIGGLDTPQFYIGMVDYTSILFNDSRLPNPDFLALDTWNIAGAFISYEDQAVNASRRVNFMFDSMTVEQTPTPAPSTILLLASGILGLAGARRKLKK